MSFHPLVGTWRKAGLRVLMLIVLTGRCDLLRCSAQQITHFLGKPVLHIQLQTQPQLNISEFKKEILQETGQPLDAQKVSQSLKNLYSTGRFRTLQAEIQPEEGGINLIFAGKARYFLGTVTVNESPQAVPPEALASSTRLSLGQPISRSSLQAAVGHIRDVLSGDGYYQAQVSYSLQRNPAVQIADVVFTVHPGLPAKLSGVQFQGNIGLSPARLMSIAGWHRNMHLTAARIQRGLYRIHRFFTKRDRLEAAGTSQKRIYDAVHNTETLVVRIDPGPRIRVRVEGAKVSSSQLKKILPVYRDGLTDTLSLDAGTERLENYFEEKGYFSAKARWLRVQHPGEIDITYVVNRGPQEAFEGYDFRGNRSIPSAELSPLVTIQPESFPSHLHGVFSQEMLNHDVKTLTAYYESRGFLQARVTPVLSKKEGELFVTFNIHEGPLTRVGTLSFKGVDDETAKQLRALLQALPGHSYSPALINKDRNSILTYFADHGYNEATVTAHVSPPDRDEVNVEYEIAPGVQKTIQRVVVMGNRYTRTGVIRRQLEVKSGEPMSQSKIFDSQRRLYDLGLFNSVQLAPANPTGDETAKTLLVDVEEARRWTLGYGFGIDVQRLGGSNQPQGQLRASPRLSLDLTRINVGGRDQTFSLRGRLSDLETGGEASYLIPHLLNHPSLSLHVDGIVDRTRDILTFTSTVRQASLSVEKQLNPSTYLVGRYNYRLVSVADLKINPLEIPLFTQPVRDAGFESTFIHDTRDNPADATRGTYSLLDASVSTTHLGSQANFVRFFGQNSTYYRINTHLVFARNTEVGVENPYGAARKITLPGVSSEVFSSNQIPLAERFFAGGADSLRAFSLNQAGPRDPITGFPVGGNALFLNSLELRVPLRGGRYGLVLFNDAGNVYSSLGEMRLLKFKQTSPADLNYTVQAIGLGLRYKTPIGPVRLDLGYDLNAPRFQFRPQPNGPLQVQQLPKFQYFISIGQSF